MSQCRVPSVRELQPSRSLRGGHGSWHLLRWNRQQGRSSFHLMNLSSLFNVDIPLELDLENTLRDEANGTTALIYPFPSASLSLKLRTTIHDLTSISGAWACSVLNP